MKYRDIDRAASINEHLRQLGRAWLYCRSRPRDEGSHVQLRIGEAEFAAPVSAIGILLIPLIGEAIAKLQRLGVQMPDPNEWVASIEADDDGGL